jgi:membrane associated rhomboid family serine protease
MRINMDDLSKGYSMNAYTSDNAFMQFIHSLNALKAHIPFAVCVLVLLVLIHLLNMALNFRLNYLGIRPRQIKGLIGIPCAPFIHANFTHLLFNSLPLFVFVDVILLQGVVIFFVCTFLIVLTSGGLIWLFGRQGLHIGASSLIMGYLGYIWVHIYFNPTQISILIGFVCIYYFGGLFLQVLPSKEKQISWEGHLLGLISGVITGFVLH